MSVCVDRYSHLSQWIDWISRLTASPTEVDVSRWVFDIGYFGGRDSAEEMGEDIWNILVQKVSGPGTAILSHAMTENHRSALTRSSRTWHQLLRDSGGRLVDRRMRLSDAINAPARVSRWDEVPEAYCRWEERVTEYECLTSSKLEDSHKAQILLRIVPQDLKELTMSQSGLEDSFGAVRDYILIQLG